MKRIIVIIVILASLLSCNKKVGNENYITIKGLIANNQASNIDIESRGFNKRIPVNLDGSFSDTLKVINEGVHKFNDGENTVLIHIKNGDVLNVEYDYTKLDSTIQFSGIGFETSKYINERKKIDKKEGIRQVKSFYKLSPNEFSTKIKRIENELSNLLELDIDSTLKSNEIKRNAQFFGYLRKNYAKEHGLLTRLKKGTKSPIFTNYESIDGKKFSLEDFKGKYIYIDVWATWCGPCKREIPHLKALIKEYANQDVAFVSISVDNGRGYKNDAAKAKKAWRKMIKDKNMKGVQLYADKAWNSDFIKAFGIRSIPRFILIDDKGNIVDPNAPRPSNLEIKNLLNAGYEK